MVRKYVFGTIPYYVFYFFAHFLIGSVLCDDQKAASCTIVRVPPLHYAECCIVFLSTFETIVAFAMSVMPTCCLLASF